jgi:tripartite-type tricarboxylate transporter receptor subunit TctC
VTRLQRSPLFPELPTLDEAGVTGFDMDSWAGIVAPAHTPPPIVTKLNKELRKIIDDPDVKAKLGNAGFERSPARPRSSGTSSRSSWTSGARWSGTPASNRSSLGV